MNFRSLLFWLHLVAGLSIGIMCFTGTVLAFEKELIAWSERDARQVTPPPAGTPRLTLEQMQASLRNAQPEARPANIVLQNDPAAAVAFTVGRSGGFHVNPYTGEVRQPAPAPSAPGTGGPGRGGGSSRDDPASRQRSRHLCRHRRWRRGSRP